MNGKIIIAISIMFWVICLGYMTFVSKNPYLNYMIFFFGIIITICGLSFGCEKIEKQK
jgi:hypothetical protein